jgi:lantibiotic leader peptide-processing serine protease
MHKSWRFIPSLAVTFGVLAMLVVSSTGAWAQDQAGDSPGAAKRYVLMSSSGTWGAAENATIARLGGTVGFSHAGSGIGSAVSADPQFLKAIMKSGTFSKGSEDMMVQWQSPVNEQELTEDSVNPADDNFINLQWSMTAIHAAGAWSAGYDGSGVRVAVIDGGMCDLHPDIAPNLDAAHSTSFVPGFTFNQDTGGPTAFRHACHVAGIIAAADNTIGTIGVAPHATIISVKALHNGSGSFEAVIQAILYASDPISAGGGGADIINMSLGATFARGGGNTGAGALVAALNQAVNYATAHNVLVVCSAGNNALDLDHSGSIITVPAMSGSAIAVSATAPVGFAVGWPNGATNFSDPATYSNYGHSEVWVGAPGGDSALPGSALCSIPRVVGPPVTTACWVFDLVLSPGSQSGSYFFASGTSMAAPHVAGVAALIKQKFPTISVGDLKTAIAQSADPMDNGAFYGHGFLDAAAAVAASTPELLASKPGRLESASRVELTIARNGSAGAPELSFTLPSAGPAKVELFDVAGRKVAVLYDGQASAGRTTLSWAAGNSLHAGAYFARLTASGVQQAKQIVVLGQ